MARLLLAAVALCALASASVAQSSKVIKVTPGQAKCLADNIETYESYDTDPVIIVLETCPRPPSNEQLTASLVQRNSGLGLPTPRVGSGDNILILLRSQLACIKDLVTGDALPTNEAGLIEISLDQCSG
ncbi:MAG: hypothetical protein AAGE61_19185 [Pseudomonadota bacterium]